MCHELSLNMYAYDGAVHSKYHGTWMTWMTSEDNLQGLFCPLPSGFWGPHSGHQAFMANISPTESSLQPGFHLFRSFQILAVEAQIGLNLEVFLPLGLQVCATMSSSLVLSLILILTFPSLFPLNSHLSTYTPHTTRTLFIHLVTYLVS